MFARRGGARLYAQRAVHIGPFSPLAAAQSIGYAAAGYEARTTRERVGRLFFHTKQLQYNAKLDRPDPVYAKQLQELIGGCFRGGTVAGPPSTAT